MCREEGEAPAPVAQPSCMVTMVKPNVTHLGIPEEVALLKPGDGQSEWLCWDTSERALLKDHIKQDIKIVYLGF